MRKAKKWVTLWLVATIIALNLLVLTPTAVYACSCAMSESPDKELDRSTAVFAGKVTDIQLRDGFVISTDDPVTVTFEVSEVWKGSVQKVQTIRTVRSETSCGYEFEAGKEYLVYANGSAANLEVFLCSRTRLLTTAVPDLVVLGAGTIPDNVAPVQWLPALFFTVMGLFLILSGLFKPQIDRRLGFAERSRLFTNPHFRQSARKTALMGRILLVLLGISFILHGIGNSFAAYGILNLFASFFLTLTVMTLLIIIGTVIYFGWIK